MFQFEKKIISGNISKFNVYLNQIDLNLRGILYNDNYNCVMTFNGLSSMMSTLEEFFNYVNFPQASHKERRFKNKKLKLSERKPPSSLRDSKLEELSDKKPDFILHVKFRRDATWQGTILIEGKEIEFLSELELSKIIIDYLEK